MTTNDWSPLHQANPSTYVQLEIEPRGADDVIYPAEVVNFVFGHGWGFECDALEFVLKRAGARDIAHSFTASDYTSSFKLQDENGRKWEDCHASRFETPSWNMTIAGLCTCIRFCFLGDAYSVRFDSYEFDTRSDFAQYVEMCFNNIIRERFVDSIIPLLPRFSMVFYTPQYAEAQAVSIDFGIITDMINRSFGSKIAPKKCTQSVLKSYLKQDSSPTTVAELYGQTVVQLDLMRYHLIDEPEEEFVSRATNVRAEHLVVLGSIANSHPLKNQTNIVVHKYRNSPHKIMLRLRVCPGTDGKIGILSVQRQLKTAVSRFAHELVSLHLSHERCT